MRIRQFISTIFIATLLGACSSAPFGYADNRCTGQQNQCQSDCANLDDGPGRSACIQRCYSVENTCSTSGYDGTGSSLAVDSGVAASRSRAEKEAAYEEWRAKKARERAASGESDVEIKVNEQ
ncbi:hypothetical protein [Hyphococcus sp.]|uniref:hypothetical protein n=1 Tax=Hyphococcus sp. TaxID=2038636 RepID=UPI0020876CB8|nr:MAG: hypothetical protein DHS20C04_09270 [Marinicaulis sp.]